MILAILFISLPIIATLVFITAMIIGNNKLNKALEMSPEELEALKNRKIPTIDIS